MSSPVQFEGEPILQVLDSKLIVSDQKQRYRLLLSDGQCWSKYSVLSSKLNDLVTEGSISKNTIIQGAATRHIGVKRPTHIGHHTIGSVGAGQ